MKIKKGVAATIIFGVGLITIISLSGLDAVLPQNNLAIEKKTTMEQFFLTTDDNLKIAADLYETPNIPQGWVILIHMMPSTKESWKDLAEYLLENNYESIAIDLRGHGRSENGPSGYTNFSDEQHQQSILDLKAAVNYLMQNRGASADKINLIGASIGANLSLQYIAENPQFKTAILLSSGLNYRGIETESLIKKLKTGQKVFFVSSKNDNNNVKENQKLYDLTSTDVIKDIKIYETGGHGTDILNNQSELKNLIINFIQK